ncbi:hypothetical protein BDF20DRAFT_966642 [Mycotypha africana]|uniref:uncharacterized protein n=1 Tax=Mycotypha africana TaxID=64632 RepID=UPI002300FD91|nr:uncharacterized protein BDF20DRAFT_966642 [Mycotypha africana]KAI8990846.1 hypothetical protein BDF20DRAFT_966642 [Mycotypha africana]
MAKTNTRSVRKERRGSLVTPNIDIDIVNPNDDHSKFSVIRKQHADLNKASIQSWQELKKGCSSLEDILTTVRRLPLDNVRPLLQELLAQFDVQQARNTELTEWIKAVLLTHTAYFMSLPDVVQRLSTLYKELDDRLTVYPKLLAMHGRLDLIQRQIDAHNTKDKVESEEERDESDAGVQAYTDSENDFDDEEDDDDEEEDDDVEEEAVQDDDDDLMEMDDENNMFKEEEGLASDDDDEVVSDTSDLEA